MGLQDYLIKVLGRWESAAYTLYIRTPPDVLCKVAGLMTTEDRKPNEVGHWGFSQTTMLWTCSLVMSHRVYVHSRVSVTGNVNSGPYFFELATSVYLHDVKQGTTILSIVTTRIVTRSDPWEKWVWHPLDHPIGDSYFRSRGRGHEGGQSVRGHG